MQIPTGGNEALLAAQQRGTDHIVTVINHAWLGMLLSLGERLDVHATLADAGPRPARELARLGGYDERYLTEWLWAMAAAGIVRVGPGADPTFELDPAYVPALTAAGGPEHWSRITTQVTAFAQLEDHLVDAFTSGAGLDALHYEGRIAEVLAGESGPIFERALLQETLPLTGLTERLEQGASIADLGCGTGSAALLLAREYPNTNVLGVDQSRTAVETATTRAREAGLTNVRFEVADLEDNLDLGTHDLIFVANTVHDLSDPAGFFARVRTALADDGVLYLHELSAGPDMRDNARDPHALGILTFSLYHCLPLAKRRDGIAPGGMWGRDAYVDALRAAGFERIEIHNAPSDPNNDTILARPSTEPAR